MGSRERERQIKEIGASLGSTQHGSATPDTFIYSDTAVYVNKSLPLRGTLPQEHIVLTFATSVPDSVLSGFRLFRQLERKSPSFSMSEGLKPSGRCCASLEHTV